MIVLLELILITSIWNLGLAIVLSDGMALEKLRVWAEGKENRVFEPLLTCVWCRPSIHGIIGFLFAFALGIIELNSWNNLFLYPLVVAGSSLVSGGIWSIYKLIEIKTKYYQHLEKHAFFDLKNRKADYHKSKN